MNDDTRSMLREAFAAAAPHLLAAGRELLNAGTAFVAALTADESHTTTVVEVDVTADD